MLTFEEQIRGGTRNPNRNLDLTIDVDSDWSTYLHRVVTVDRISGDLAPYSPSESLSIVGILQNVVSSGQAIIRYAGVSRAVYGGVVTADDRLKIDDATGKLVTWVPGTDGHTHAANNAPMESVLVRVVDLKDAGVAGLTSSDIIARQWYRAGGAIAEHAASTSVTEDDGLDGWYEVAVTEIQYLGFPHRLSIEAVNPDYIITPSEYPWTPRASTSGPAVAETLTLVVGIALEDGVADDEKLIRILPQIF